MKDQDVAKIKFGKKLKYKGHGPVHPDMIAQSNKQLSPGNTYTASTFPVYSNRVPFVRVEGADGLHHVDLFELKNDKD